MSESHSTDLPSIEALKKDALALGREAAELARERVLQPAQELVRESRRELDAAGERLKEGTVDAGEVLRGQGERAGAWIAAHPWAAMGIAFGAGWLVSELVRERR